MMINYYEFSSISTSYGRNHFFPAAVSHNAEWVLFISAQSIGRWYNMFFSSNNEGLKLVTEEQLRHINSQDLCEMNAVHFLSTEL